MNSFFRKNPFVRKVQVLISVCLFIVLVSIFAETSFADMPGSGRFGLGLVLGGPTAITGKYWSDENHAIDFGFGFAAAYNVYFYGDYEWHWPAGFGKSSKFVSQLNPYIGVGLGVFSWNGAYYYGDRPRGWAGYNSSTGVFARFPFGIEWFPGKPPLGVFLELTPSMAIIPGMWVFFDLGLGIRYYF